MLPLKNLVSGCVNHDSSRLSNLVTPKLKGFDREMMLHRHGRWYQEAPRRGAGPPCVFSVALGVLRGSFPFFLLFLRVAGVAGRHQREPRVPGTTGLTSSPARGW